MTYEQLNRANKMQNRLITLQRLREDIKEVYGICHSLNQIDSLYNLEDIDISNIEYLILDYIDKTEDKLYEQFREI